MQKGVFGSIRKYLCNPSPAVRADPTFAGRGSVQSPQCNLGQWSPHTGSRRILYTGSSTSLFVLRVCLEDWNVWTRQFFCQKGSPGIGLCLAAISGAPPSRFALVKFTTESSQVLYTMYKAPIKLAKTFIQQNACARVESSHKSTAWLSNVANHLSVRWNASTSFARTTMYKVVQDR